MIELPEKNGFYLAQCGEQTILLERTIIGKDIVFMATLKEPISFSYIRIKTFGGYYISENEYIPRHWRGTTIGIPEPTSIIECEDPKPYL